MKFSAALPLFASGLLLAAVAQPAAAQTASTPAAAIPVNDAEYVPLEQLRSFYKLLPLPGNKNENLRLFGNSGTTLTFGPGKKDLSIGGYRCLLSHPIREDGVGDLLISKVDMVKLIDPILRPTYISDRRLVRTVVIDPGHGGYDIGTQGETLKEAAFTLQLARELRESLIKRGYTVVLTHEQDRHLSDQQRIASANEADAAIFISLHLNSGRSDIKGIETYTAAPDQPGDKRRPAHKYDAANTALAFALHSSLIATTEATDGACRRAQYSILNSADCPAVMLLLGYATNKEEEALLATQEYRTKLVTAITEGIATFAVQLNPQATLAPAPEAEPEPPTPVKVEPPKPEPPKTKPKATPAKKKQTGTTRKRRSNNKRKK